MVKCPPVMNTILAVEDDADVRSTIQRALQREGHCVLEAESGEQALRMARQYQPDVIILDITLPDTNGFAICADLRSMPRVDYVPILFLSSHQSAQFVAKALDCGGDDYLRKPFAIRELKARVRALLRRAPNRHGSEQPVLYMQPDGQHVVIDNRRVSLTPTEYGLLDFLCRHSDTYHNAFALLENLWEYPPNSGDTALVRNHIRNLRRKIERDPDHPSIVVSLHGRGYTINALVRYPSAEPPALPIR
jgi:DNA-binding response OmpR family regulator